jgi:3-polyprenyl-4-hydroxybenzoate decarboxylase
MYTVGYNIMRRDICKMSTIEKISKGVIDYLLERWSRVGFSERPGI